MDLIEKFGKKINLQGLRSGLQHGFLNVGKFQADKSDLASFRVQAYYSWSIAVLKAINYSCTSVETNHKFIYQHMSISTGLITDEFYNSMTSCKRVYKTRFCWNCLADSDFHFKSQTFNCNSQFSTSYDRLLFFANAPSEFNRHQACKPNLAGNRFRVKRKLSKLPRKKVESKWFERDSSVKLTNFFERNSQLSVTFRLKLFSKKASLKETIQRKHHSYLKLIFIFALAIGLEKMISLKISGNHFT